VRPGTELRANKEELQHLEDATNAFLEARETSAGDASALTRRMAAYVQALRSLVRIHALSLLVAAVEELSLSAATRQLSGQVRWVKCTAADALRVRLEAELEFTGCR
jgi:hypothetical protein